MKYLVSFSRIFTGLLFILSGLIKANDPTGFSFKLEEYFTVLNLGFMHGSELFLATLICIVEVALGLTLLLGVYVRLTAWLLLLMILFFTFLTWYSATYNKVTDCGCFGDALKGVFGRSLTPWESFGKDVVLLVLVLIIFFGQKHIRPVFSKAAGNALAALGTLAITIFSLACIWYLPVIDFLPYKEGNDIVQQMQVPENARKDSILLTFIYEKDGQRYEFDQNSISGQDLSAYKFVDRVDKIIVEGDKAPIHDFSLMDAQGNELTDLLFEQDDYKLVWIEKDIKHGNDKAREAFKTLSDAWIAKGKQVFGLTASNLADVEAYRHEHQFGFRYYNVDGTALKTMIRSNPGLMLLKKSTVIKKWAAREIPSPEELASYMQ